MIDLENYLKESIESHLISLRNEFQRYFLNIMTNNFIWKLVSLQRHPRFYGAGLTVGVIPFIVPLALLCSLI
jgi:hypothetical protein